MVVSFLIFLQCFFAYLNSPLLFLTTPSATHTTHKVKAWNVIKMLRGSFIWTHKPEHLLMVAGARLDMLGQLGSPSQSLISHAAKQPCRAGAQSASAVPPGSACFSELAVCFIHTALRNTSELKNGKSLDRSGYWTTWDRYLIPCMVLCLYIQSGITSALSNTLLVLLRYKN